MLKVQLKARYEGFKLDVRADIANEGVTALFGPTGSGKTSLLRSIAGLDRHQGARIVFNEQVWQQDNAFVSPHQRNIGYVFQEASLFAHLDVLGNIRFGAQRARGKPGFDVNEVIEILGLRPLLKRDPATLSGGERQRVAVARAVASNPQLLLMDEPLSALDASSKDKLLTWLEILQQQLRIPTLFVSHQLDEIARLAEQMLLLRDGCIEAQGPLNEVLTHTGLSLAQSPGASCVIHAKVKQLDSQWGLTCLQFHDEELWTPGLHRNTDETVRVRIAARDVSIALTRPENSSILNIVSATVAELVPESTAQVLLKLNVSGTMILARVTARSVSELRLEPGSPVFAQIKSVALLNSMDEQSIGKQNY